MPRQPRNLHFVATWHSSDNAIRKKHATHDTSKVLRLPRKLQRVFRKRRKSIAPATTKRLWTRYKTRPNVTKCHACHAKRSNTTCVSSKCDPLRELTIGTAIRASRGRPRTVGQHRVTTPSTLRPQSETGTFATHSGVTEGSLEVKLPTIWTDEKQSREEAGRRERFEERRVIRKKMQMREKVGKSRRHCVFPMIWGSGGSKSRLAKAAGAEPAGQNERWKIARRCGAKHISKSKCTKHTRCGPLLAVEMSKKCTPLWREAHFEVKMYKTHHSRTTFSSWDVQKVHAVLARSTFPSQNVKNTRGSDHFWKFRSRKSARRCGAKHISKSKCTKHTSSGPLLAVEMSKKCTPLWRAAHFQVKMLKTLGVRTTFGSSDLEKVHEAHFEVKMLKTLGVRTTFGGADAVSRGRSTRLWMLSKVEQKHEGFAACRQKMAGMGHLKMICKDAFSVAGAVQKTCSWERLGGQGADFLRGVTFWSIRSVGLLRWFCMIGAACRMTWQPVFVAGAVL